MSLRYADFRFCNECQRGTPHNAKGGCATCRSRVRHAVRKAKASAQGSNLVRYSDVRRIADDLWSVMVRASHVGCVMCGAPSHPSKRQCAHGWSREERIIRFDPDNTFSLCPSCHRRHTPPGQLWLDWMLKYLGEERYGRLAYLSRVGGKLRLSDVHLVIVDAQQRIAALPEGENKTWAREREQAIGERMVRLGVRAA